MWVFITVFHLLFTPSQALICQAYGSVYEVDEAYLADLIVFEELSEVAADVVVYEQQNRLYADKPGMWYFEEKVRLILLSILQNLNLLPAAQDEF